MQEEQVGISIIEPNPPEKKVFIIKRTGKRGSLTGQTQRDTEKINSRIRMNQHEIPKVEMELLRYFSGRPIISELLTLASELVNGLEGELKLNLKIDRLAKRNRDCLLCWFAEHWDLLGPKIATLPPLPPHPPRHYGKKKGNMPEMFDDIGIPQEDNHAVTNT